MDEPQNAEEDLLAFLQPLTMPDEFTFEARTRHFEDSSDDGVDQEPIPGPAPPAPMAPIASTAPVAPMAPMGPIETTESVASVASDAPTIEHNGIASLAPLETNGHKEDKTVVEQDDDAIEYETPKATRKSPAKRSIRSRVTPKARKDAEDESPYDSAAELLKKFATSSAKKRVETKPDPESHSGASVGSPVKPGKRTTRETTGESARSEAESSPNPLKFEVVIKPLPPAAAQEYTKVAPGDEIFRVLEIIKTDVPGEAWLSVEFEDSRVDQVSHSYRTGSLHSKHKTCSLDTVFLPSSHPTKWNLITCCLSLCDFTSFLFTTTTSFPDTYPHLPSYQLRSAIPVQPSHTAATCPPTPNIKQSTSWRSGIACQLLPP